jgi:hypothetical protein
MYKNKKTCVIILQKIGEKMQNEFQKEEDMDKYSVPTLKDNIVMFSLIIVFSVLWITLMIALPLSIIIGYFSLMFGIVAALWMSPRIVDVGIEDNGNFVKVSK